MQVVQAGFKEFLHLFNSGESSLNEQKTYDVDGTTAVSLVYKYLRPYSSALDYYIPDRYDEGYGISYKGINYARENGITLVISLDCGIKAIEKIEYAKQLGIDFIICDHHMPDDTLPDAVADNKIDPQLLGIFDLFDGLDAAVERDH